MQPLTQSLNTRRLSMLKAMGVELWWAKAAKVAVDGAAAVQRPVAPQQAVEGAQPAARPAQTVAREGIAATPVAAASASPVAVVPLPTAPPVQHPSAEPAAKRVIERAQPSSFTAASSPAVLWTSPTLWQARQEQELPALAGAQTSEAAGLLLLVDDLQALGDAQAAAMQLLENMVRAMGLAHSPALWLSWAKRPPQEPVAEAAGGQQSPVASAQQLVADTRARAVLVMGRDAAQHWLGSSEPLGALRQASHHAHGLPVVVTYSPAYLLRATHAKRQAWADLQRVMVLLAATANP